MGGCRVGRLRGGGTRGRRPPLKAGRRDAERAGPARGMMAHGPGTGCDVGLPRCPRDAEERGANRKIGRRDWRRQASA
jgi:hypothetical protein